jgi:hypothetical protein
MKFKKLFLGMLGAALFVGCNNESPLDGTDDGKVRDGISTTATFQLKVQNPSATYAGESAIGGTETENSIQNAILLIYKLDGTPEAMGFLADATVVGTENSGNPAPAATSPARVTLKCTSGDKLIYLATNIGNANPDTKLFNADQATTNAVSPWEGTDWSGAAGTGKEIDAINVAIWPKKPAGAAPFVHLSNAVPSTDLGVTVDTLILALTGNGDPANGILNGAPKTTTEKPLAGYLMSNWGSAVSQPDDNIEGGGSNYVSTCKFTLEPNVDPDASRTATPTVDNADHKNALLINIQRAVAKVQIQSIGTSVLNGAGSGSNAGIFAPVTKWAVGNINKSTYPFQQWDGSIVKSTRYDDTAAINGVDPQDWDKKFDNSRWLPVGKTYLSQDLTTKEVIERLTAASDNVSFGNTNTERVLVTENNNREALNHYSTFVTFAGQYKPSTYVVNVSSLAQVKDSTAFPNWTLTGSSVTNLHSGETNVDTLFYVSDIQQGRFFLGRIALQQYVCWVVLGKASTVNPLTDPQVASTINSWAIPSGNTQAKLQAYWRGYCFYRVWIADNKATAAANKKLVRRNHIYDIEITKINGPGIGDPKDLIDPTPETTEPTEETATYVTATVNLMQWHIVGQKVQAGLD